jgi:virulence factor
MKEREQRMSTERTTLAVLGLGGIAQKAHLPVLATLSDIDVVALANRSGRGITELAAKHRFPIQATTVDQVIACRPKGALVLTESESHAELTCRLLEAGIAVYLEKPMATNVADARRVTECAHRTGQLLMVGFNRRFAPFYQQLKEQFFDQPAGQCHLVKTRQAGGIKQSPAQAVWDDVIHLIDLSRWLMGEPQQVHTTIQRGPEGEFAGLSVLLQYPDGRSATLAQPVRAGGVRELVELYGNGRSAWLEDLQVLHTQQGGITATYTHEAWTPTLTRRGFTAALDHFLDCLNNGHTPSQSAQDALKSHELAQTILDAAGA